MHSQTTKRIIIYINRHPSTYTHTNLNALKPLAHKETPEVPRPFPCVGEEAASPQNQAGALLASRFGGWAISVLRYVKTTKKHQHLIAKASAPMHADMPKVKRVMATTTALRPMLRPSQHIQARRKGGRRFTAPRNSNRIKMIAIPVVTIAIKVGTLSSSVLRRTIRNPPMLRFASR